MTVCTISEQLRIRDPRCEVSLHVRARQMIERDTPHVRTITGGWRNRMHPRNIAHCVLRIPCFPASEPSSLNTYVPVYEEMSAVPPTTQKPRRSHNKSRAGCTDCKKRRIRRLPWLVHIPDSCTLWKLDNNALQHAISSQPWLLSIRQSRF
jgi:hypothetical protein